MGLGITIEASQRAHRASAGLARSLQPRATVPSYHTVRIFLFGNFRVTYKQVGLTAALGGSCAGLIIGVAYVELVCVSY